MKARSPNPAKSAHADSGEAQSKNTEDSKPNANAADLLEEAKKERPKVLRIAKGQRRPSQVYREQMGARSGASSLGGSPWPGNTAGSPGSTAWAPNEGAAARAFPGSESSGASRASVREAANALGAVAGGVPARPATMSVAAKNRAVAEAAFKKLTPSTQVKDQSGGVSVGVRAAPATSSAQPSGAAGQGHHKSDFELRISHRDSLTTALRLAESDSKALEAAQELAHKFQLPPDQNLLIRIVELGDETLTKLALEELLELDDRGRVRPNRALVDAVGQIRSVDRETVELKDLFLEKIGRLES